MPSNNWFKFLKMPLKTEGTGMTTNTLGLVQSGKFSLDGKTQRVTDKHLKRGLACSSNRPGLAAVGLSEVKPSERPRAASSEPSSATFSLGDLSRVTRPLGVMLKGANSSNLTRLLWEDRRCLSVQGLLYNSGPAVPQM